MLAYTKRETKCEFGSPYRNLHILLFLSAAAHERKTFFLARDFTRDQPIRYL